MIHNHNQALGQQHSTMLALLSLAALVLGTDAAFFPRQGQGMIAPPHGASLCFATTEQGKLAQSR